MKKMHWLQLFAEQAQPEPGVTADAAPEQDHAEAFRALIQGPYKKEYDRQVQTIVRERLKNCARSEQLLQALAPTLERDYGVDTASLSVEQAERLAQVSPDGKLPQTQEQREQAMRAGYERLRGQFEQVREAYPQAELAQELDDPRLCGWSCGAWTQRALTS